MTDEQRKRRDELAEERGKVMAKDHGHWTFGKVTETQFALGFNAGFAEGAKEVVEAKKEIELLNARCGLLSTLSKLPEALDQRNYRAAVRLENDVDFWKAECEKLADSLGYVANSGFVGHSGHDCEKIALESLAAHEQAKKDRT